MRIFAFIKSHWLLILLAMIAFLLLGIYLLLPSIAPKPAPSPSPQTWNGITPNLTNVNELVSLLGEPTGKRQEGQSAVFSYPTQSESLSNEVFVSNNVVGLIKEQIIDDTKGLAYYKETFGEPEATFYGPYAQSGFLLYVFASKGIAVLAHQYEGLVFEVWRFSPMTVGEFKALWGQGLSSEPQNQL